MNPSWEGLLTSEKNPALRIWETLQIIPEHRAVLLLGHGGVGLLPPPRSSVGQRELEQESRADVAGPTGDKLLCGCLRYLWGNYW